MIHSRPIQLIHQPFTSCKCSLQMATQSVLHRHDIDMQENNELLVDYASEHVPNMVMQVTNV